MTKTKLKSYEGLFYILPWVAGFLIFQLYPFISSFIYSFTNYNMMRTPSFVGLKNYIDLFTNDRDFWKSVWTTIQFAFLSVPVKLVFALLVAVILNMKMRAVNFYRTVYYLPSLFGGSVAVSILWRLMFMNDGVINQLIGKLGIGPVSWLGSTDVALHTIIILQVWQFGSSMVLFLAALKGVPQELYEASKIDGAGSIRIFFNVTLPMITPIIFFNMLMQLNNALQNFPSAFVVTGGGPQKSTYVLGMKLYEDAFTHFKMGYASALSWVMFAIIMGFTFILFRSSNMWVHYEDGGKL